MSSEAKEATLADETIDRAPGRTLRIAFFVRRRAWETITVRSELPKSQRDVRLDLFRGLANWLIFLGHIPDTTLVWFTTRNYGFSDGADLFVLISGYTATLVFGKMMMERGFVIGATRLLRRVWQLYVAHLLLFFSYLTAVHYLAHKFDDLHLMDQFNVTLLMKFPVETLSQGFVLKFKPLNLDVLPLYIVLMAAFPIILWVMLRWRNAVMIGSVGLYVAARHYGWNFASYPAGVWYFNPFAWQLLFVFGAWLALGGTAVFSSALRAMYWLPPVCSCLHPGRTNSRTATVRPERRGWSIHSERQDQSRSLPRDPPGKSGVHRRLAHSDRLAGAQVADLQATYQMRAAVAACVLRRPVPVLYRAFRDRVRFGRSIGPARGRGGRFGDPDDHRILSDLVEGGRQEFIFRRKTGATKGQ